MKLYAYLKRLSDGSIRRMLSVLIIAMIIMSLYPKMIVNANAVSALPIPSQGLNLWLKADEGVTADAVTHKVSAWADQSGNGNDVTQDDPALQPVVVTDAVYTTNNKPAIKFEAGVGNTPFLRKTLDSPYTGDSSIVAVVKQNELTPGGGKGFFATDAFHGQDMNNGSFALIQDWDQGGLFLGGEGKNARVSNASTEYAIISVTVDTAAGTVKSYVNGQLVSNATDVKYKELNTYISYLLGRSYWYNSVNADLTEIAVYRNVLSDSDRALIEHYLNNKYAIYGVTPPPQITIPTDGLNLWLRADAGVIANAETHKVSAWEDQSGNGNHVTQDDPALQPMVVTDAEYTANNKPAIKFEAGFGNTPYLMKTLDTPYTGSSSIVAVVKQNELTPGHGQGFFGTDYWHDQSMNNGAFGLTQDWGQGGLLVSGEQGNARISQASTSYATLIVTIDSTLGTVKSYINGELVGDNTSEANKSLKMYAAYAIGRSYWYNTLNADISEIAVYRHVLSDADRGTIQHYLDDKYQISNEVQVPPVEVIPRPAPTSLPATTEHSASGSFTSVQGTDGWFSMKKAGTTYSLLSQYIESDSPKWTEPAGFPFVNATSFQPDNTIDAVKKWVAPRSGNIQISGVIHKLDTSGNGVEAQIYKNTMKLWSSEVTSEDVIPSVRSNIHVDAGDVIYFVIGANGDRSHDETNWAPEIIMETELNLDAESYSSISGAVRIASRDADGGDDVSLTRVGDYVQYHQINLSGGFKTLETRLSTMSTGGKFEVHMDTLDGPIISTFIVANTDGWDQYETQVWPVNANAVGVHDIYVKAVSGTDIARIHWMKFTNNETRGATMPFKTYEAESADLGGGATLNEDLSIKNVSSGKSYVHLNAIGEYVQWRNVRDSNTFLLRYSIPQNESGTLNLYINGIKKQAINLNSTYNYDSMNANYGRRYDEKDIKVEIQAGDTIKLQKDSDNLLAWYAIDLIDLETAPAPLEMPANFLSVKDAPFYAIGDGIADDTAAIQSAVNAAAVAHKHVWIPEGTYNQSDRILVPSEVDVKGAGIWYTHLHSTVSFGAAAVWKGKVGFTLNNNSVISDMRISGIETCRDCESAMAITTVPGHGQYNYMQNLWVEHIGAFVGWTELHHSVVQNVRLRDLYFDGVHWGDMGNTFNIAQNNSMRGLGDDGVAQVNLNSFDTKSMHNLAQFNSISANYWGRGMADVGGNSLTMRDNVLDSTIVAGMIITTEPVAPGADSFAIEGLKFQRNSILRAGHEGHNHAGLHFWLYVSPMKDVRIELNTIQYGETEGVHIDDTSFGDEEGRTQFNYNTITNNLETNFNNANSRVVPSMTGNILKTTIPDINEPLFVKATTELTIFDEKTLQTALETVKEDNGKTKIISFKIPGVEGQKSYSVQLPVSSLNKDKMMAKMAFVTNMGTIMVPTNMLSSSHVGSDQIVLTITAVDKSKLTQATQALIGNKPVIDLSLKVDGQTVPWNNPAAPVNISIPYIPTKDELNSANNLTVWYMDGNGTIQAVPSGKFDATTGMITFSTTHFSQYAVAFVKKSFLDLDTFPWAQEAINVMASKGIINGTSEGIYHPEMSITRADALLLLVKSLSLTADVGREQPFTDVGKTDYYTEAVAIAKELGIIQGMGNDLFKPQETISRQDFIVMLDRAIVASRLMMTSQTNSNMNDYADKDRFASYAVESMRKLVRLGIITGDGQLLNPTAKMTRAEIAVILYRVYLLS
ncbi:hypothetical protein A8709_13115 [Paenibacillus pectinilyticus]|uniref:Uncharacterized protein n=2 Tax=Paenibacillus pectinilyticus TaxID=512399 RepID=A0A1C1A3A9_9BACL|nr:hypothetical protein A8709_13115 [Paenibacillus pectinilyticus]